MKRALPSPQPLAPAEAAALLVAHHGLRRPVHPRGAAGVRALLQQARCIQLDPLEPLGSNADLVALARLDGVGRGDVYRHLFPGHAFEHFAKERCLLPASAFPWYRARARDPGWWAMGPWRYLAQRARELPEGTVERVLEEVRARGPIPSAGLGDHGRIQAEDWSGWKTTGRAATLALQVLWVRCEVVVVGKAGRGKLFDVAERALGHLAHARVHEDPAAFQRWALLERACAAGLLARASGPTWRLLGPARESGLADALVEEGILEEVAIAGSPRRYLAPAGFTRRRLPKSDGRMRLLGPLDPLIWDRRLVKEAFGFDYTWEVYKPARLRDYGWYVVPLLQGDRLVGRLEGEVKGWSLRVKKLWTEPGAAFDHAALGECLERHARACGATRVVLPRRRS